MGWTGWFAGAVDLCGVVASVLPLVAFGVTADWVRAFDCFGGITLTGDLIISYLKTGMLLFVVGLSQDTIWVIYDSVLSQLMELCLVGSSLFFYLSHKSHHGINVALAQSSLGLLIVFLLGIGAAIFGMKLNWLMSDRDIKWYTGITVCANFLQFFIPVIIRLAYQNMDNDERMVFSFKMISTGLCLITASYESWNIGTHLNITDWERMVCLLVVYIFSAASSLVQCVVRIVGPERFAKCAKQLWAKTCCG